MFHTGFDSEQSRRWVKGEYSVDPCEAVENDQQRCGPQLHDMISTLKRERGLYCFLPADSIEHTQLEIRCDDAEPLRRRDRTDDVIFWQGVRCAGKRWS